jgi:hypothetical protein
MLDKRLEIDIHWFVAIAIANSKDARSSVCLRSPDRGSWKCIDFLGIKKTVMLFGVGQNL